MFQISVVAKIYWRVTITWFWLGVDIFQILYSYSVLFYSEKADGPRECLDKIL